MDLVLRHEEENDHRIVENIMRESFWDVYKPGCNEHLLLHTLRTSSSFVTELGYVACKNDEILGGIFYSKARIHAEDACEAEVLCLGPLAVLPAFQGQGIGTRLVRHTLEKAKALAYRGVILYGNPDYYARFGFINAQNYRITTAEGANFDAFMALELSPGSLKGVSGKFCDDEAFRLDPTEVEQFDKEFPYKEKHVTDTQFKG